MATHLDRSRANLNDKYANYNYDICSGYIGEH